MDVKVNGILLVVSYALSLTVLENYLIQIINNSFKIFLIFLIGSNFPANLYSS